MLMTQGLASESDYLYVTATGAFSLDEAQLRFLEMLESVTCRISSDQSLLENGADRTG